MSTDTCTLPTTTTTTETGRRIRGDARMERLSPEQKGYVRFWLMEEHYTYNHVAQLIRQKFSVNVGRSAVAVYYHRHFLPELHEDEVAAAAALSRLPVGDFDAVTVHHAKALAFSALTEPCPHLRTVDHLLAIVHRVHKQQIAERRIALDERRAELRAQELAARPPRRPRSENSELPSLSLSRPPRPAPPPSTALDPTEPHHAAGPEPVAPVEAPPQALSVSNVAKAPAPPPLGHMPGAAGFPVSQDPSPQPLDPALASVTSPPPPCAPCPKSSAPVRPAPLQSSTTPDSSSPSLSLVQSPPPPPSQKSPPDPPLFPASSGLFPPSPPQAPDAPQPLLTNPDAPPLLPCATASVPVPAPPKPKPRIPYREVARAEWG